jgi:hypothetical protein
VAALSLAEMLPLLLLQQQLLLAVAATQVPSARIIARTAATRSFAHRSTTKFTMRMISDIESGLLLGFCPCQ